MRATSSIPIVFNGVSDPVAMGLVTSLAHPGRNATGISIISDELGPKWAELLRELAAGAKRVAHLTDTGSEGAMLNYKRLQEHAQKLGMAVEIFGGSIQWSSSRSFDGIGRGVSADSSSAPHTGSPIIGSKSCDSLRSTSCRRSMDSANTSMPEGSFRMPWT